jgi:nucleoside-diphosphate-sugar epimerase
MNLGNEYKNKKVLITGGGGFIGSNLAIKLVGFGADVTIMDSKLEPYGFNIFNLYPVLDKIKIDYSDIRDKKSVERNVYGKEIIFNLAAQVGEKISEEKPELDRSINILGHRNVLQICKNKNLRILFSGSRLEYGNTNGTDIISEDHDMNPITPYAKNKLKGEKMYLNFNEKYNLDTVMFRITNPFGPRALIYNPGYCVVNWFVGRALNKQELPIYGDGLQLRDYIFIDDLTEAMIIAGVHKNAKGKIYNVGSGEGIQFKEMAQKIADLSENNEVKLNFIDWPNDAKNRETGNFVADISKIKNDLNWKPKFKLEEGLKKTMDFYKKNISHYIKNK